MDNPDRALLEHLIANKDFGVPLDMTHGLRELEAHLVKGEPGSLELSFNVSHRSTQGNGVVSGGTLATMLDYAMAYAVLSKLNAGKTCATTSITVNMQAAAQPSLLRAVGVVDRIGKQVAFARSEIYDNRDRLIANSTATFFIMDVKAQ